MEPKVSTTRDGREIREIAEQGNYRSSFGSSTYDVRCPFCQEWTMVYAWSFAGGGKKCDCGAKLSRWGATAPKK